MIYELKWAKSALFLSDKYFQKNTQTELGP